MTKRALLVGCIYPNDEKPLKGCVNDVMGSKKMLLSRFGFSERDIVVMVDTDKKYPQPTGANIRKALSKIVEDSRKGDIVFMHFSGHGTRAVLPPGTVDDTGYNECIVPTDINLLTDDDFRNFVNKLPSGCLFTFVSDSCHSGGLIDSTKQQIGKQGESAASAALSASRSGHSSGKPQGTQIISREGNIVVKNRALSSDSIMSMISSKHGFKGGAGGGDIYAALYAAFGKESSPTVLKYAGVALSGVPKAPSSLAGKDAHTISPVVHVPSSLPGANPKSKSGGGVGCRKEEAKPAAIGKLATQSQSNIKQGVPSVAQEKAKKGNDVVKTIDSIQKTDMGVLISGCETDEMSADVDATDKSSAYGALSHAILEVLDEHHGPIFNRDLVLHVREKLKKAGLPQNPGLFCSDSNLKSYFICK